MQAKTTYIAKQRALGVRFGGPLLLVEARLGLVGVEVIVRISEQCDDVGGGDCDCC